MLPEHLPEELAGGEKRSTAFSTPVTALENMERDAILAALRQAGGHQGKAASQLGISRRTLVRKLSQYRREELIPATLLGKLSKHEQQYFRASVTGSAELSSRSGKLSAILVNVSSRGLCLKLENQAIQPPTSFHVTFNLPGSEESFRTQSELVWAEKDGRFGARFVDIDPSEERRLSAWLEHRQIEEGWQLVAEEESSMSTRRSR